MKTLQDIGERALIARLTPRLPQRSDVTVGPGDDAAVVRAPRATHDLVLKSDAVVEGVHFRSSAPPAWIGHKAAARVLSDFAAMGAEPQHLLVDVVAPPRTRVKRIEEVYEGLCALARRWKVAVVGGETVRGPALELHVFGVGRVPRGRAVRRAGARPGDVIFVTGALGGSLAGRHLRVEPRLREGQWLRAGRWATSLIDVSDGLATDLRHLVAAGAVGADLDTHRIPVSRDVLKLRDRLPPLEHALRDGEDFELLFTVRRGHVAAFVRAWHAAFELPCTAIGAITAAPGRIRLREVGGPTRLLKDAGYEHFAG